MTGSKRKGKLEKSMLLQKNFKRQQEGREAQTLKSKTGRSKYAKVSQKA